jgi:hypothetical protein
MAFQLNNKLLLLASKQLYIYNQIYKGAFLWINN